MITSLQAMKDRAAGAPPLERRAPHILGPVPLVLAEGKTVNLAQIAAAFYGRKKVNVNYQRLQRCLGLFVAEEMTAECTLRF